MNDLRDQVNRGLLAALDRFGRPIQEGQHILMRPDVDPVFRVVEVQPILDPRAPTGLVRLRVVCEAIDLAVQANAPVKNIIVMGVSVPSGTGQQVDG